jgi:hypothetical protein
MVYAPVRFSINPDPSKEKVENSRSPLRRRSGVWLRGACLALVPLFASVTSIRAAAAQDAPPPPPPIQRLFAPLKESMKNLPSFLRDTDLGLHFRSYHFNRENPNGVANEASTFGGWARYKSGWLFDVFGIGATFYGSAKLDAPADKDGSGLLDEQGAGELGWQVRIILNWDRDLL